MWGRSKEVLGIVLLFIIICSTLGFAIPEFSENVIAIDEGQFDIDLIDDNFIIYSTEVLNRSQLYDRTLFFIYDFTFEEKRSFGRFTKSTEFFKKDNTTLFVIEPSPINVRNDSLSDFNVAFYERDLVNGDKELLKIFSYQNLTHHYFDLKEGKEGIFLFEVLSFEFLEFDNDTKIYESLGDSFEYYKLEDDTFTRIDKLTYASLKKTTFDYENEFVQLVGNSLKNKVSQELFTVATPLDQLCGISDSFIYYTSKLYYEGAQRPLSILVKYDYQNDIKQEILVQDSCEQGEKTFYANPYLFDLKSDTYNFFLSESSQAQVLDGKLVFIDQTLDFVYVDVEDVTHSQNDSNSSLLSETENESLTLKVSEELDEELIVSQDLNASSLGVEKDESELVVEEPEENIFLSLISSPRNLIIGVILLEVILAVVVIFYFFLPERERSPREEKSPLREPQISLENESTTRFSFSLPKLSLKIPSFSFSRKEQRKHPIGMEKVSLHELRSFKAGKLGK